MDSSGTYKSARLEINMLGQFAIIIDGKKIPETAIKGRKARSLLKVIAHQRHCQVVREQVMDIIWPELDVEAASSQLYKAIHHIRKALSDHAEDASIWIEMSNNVIRLVPPGGLVTDVQRFEQTAREGLRNEKISELEMAASIYNGDFLPMERYSEWTSLPREHYRQLYIDVMTLLAREYNKAGKLSEAAEILRMALEKEPTLETAHRGLMQIFARKGQPTRAFHQYDLCRKVLKDDLGMSPASETKNLLNDIREGRLTMDQNKKQLKATKSADSSTPIIGRDEECSIIEILLDKLLEGKGGVLSINGEAGIGKTRLIQDLIHRSRRKSISFFLGRTNTESGAYGPIVSLFNEMLHKRPELDEVLPVELGKLIPDYSGSGNPVPHADKLAAKEYLFAQAHRFISKITDNKPVVVILEDLHAADQGTMDLFSYLIRHSDDLPILFVVTHRMKPDQLISNILPGMRNRTVEIIDLNPLTLDNIIHLLHQNSTITGLSTESARHIFHLSEGNPLYALELLQFYSEENLLDSSQQLEETKLNQTGTKPEKIPPSIQYIVEQKLENLSPPAHHLLNIAAVIGRQIPFELLASIWSDGDKTGNQELFEAIEEVIRARLIEEQGLDYSFKHALFRESIYTKISIARRQTLHGLVAHQLVEMSDESDRMPVEQIAHHYLQSGDILTGAQYFVEAAQHAEEIYAHEDALERYRNVLEILKDMEKKQAQKIRCEVLESIGDVYRACGRLEKSYDSYENAIALAENIDFSNKILTELYRKMSVVAIFRTEIDRSDKYLQRAFKLAGDDTQALARLFITKALHLWHLNLLEDAYLTAKKALNLAIEIDAKPEASQACEILAMTCLPLGRWEEGLEFEMQRQVYGWSPEIVVATDAHLCLWEYHVSGDQPLNKARSFMEQVSKQAAEVGDLRCVAVCHYALGTMHLWRGKRLRAIEDLASSLELHERVGSPAGMAYSLARKSVLHTLMGAKELGWRAVEGGLEYANQAAVRDHCLQRLYGVGIWNRIEADDLPQARDLVEKSEVLLNESGACAACALELYPWLAYYYLQNGEVDQAKKCSEAVSELAEKTGNPIGKSLAAIIQSSLSITEQDAQKADQFKKESFRILEDAVPETTHSPVAHFIERMVDQQAALRIE